MGVRELLLRVRGKDDGASRTLKGVGDAADKAEGNVDGMNKGLKALDDKIADTTKTLASLRAEIARTGDLELIKDVTKQEQRLKALGRQRKSLLGNIVPEPDEIAQGIGGALKSALGKVPTSGIGGVAGPLAAAIAVPVAAGVGATMSAALVGGAGVGGVLGGLLVASRDRRVRAAGAQLGEAVLGQLERSATAFVPAALDAIKIVRRDLSAIDGDLDKAFAAAARYVRPLTEGLGGLVRNVMPGLRRAIEAAGPVIREISQGLPRLGQAVGDLFDTAADNADTGASAIRGIFLAVEGVIRTVDTAVDRLSALYRVLVTVGTAGAEFGADMAGWIPIVGGQLDKNADRMRRLKDGLDDTSASGAKGLEALAGGFQRVDEEAEAAAKEVETFEQRLNRVTNANLDARAAARAFEAAIDDAKDAVKDNGRTLDEGTAKGRANAEALDRIAREALAAREAILATSGSQGQATAVMERGRAQYIATARAMGLSEAEANRLADQLFRLPRDVRTNVRVDTAAAAAAIERYHKWLNNIPTVVRTRMVTEQYAVRGGFREFSEGGPVLGRRRGVDSVPALLAPGEHVLTADEVDALGGQRRVEQWRRSLTAPTPGGGTVPTMPAGRPTVGRAVLEVRSDGTRLADLLVELLRGAVRVRGGNVQVVLGR